MDERQECDSCGEKYGVLKKFTDETGFTAYFCGECLDLDTTQVEDEE